MANSRTTEPVDPRDASPEGKTRRVPPLIWIILAILVAWFAIAIWQRQGVRTTPQGGTVTTGQEGPAYLPPAPASGSAPATPGGEVNGPNQPPPR
jgi:hypothetical protein